MFSGVFKKRNFEELCNGVEDRPTGIEMSIENDTNLYFKNYQNQQKAPCVICADFESLVQKIEGPEQQGE